MYVHLRVRFVRSVQITPSGFKNPSPVTLLAIHRRNSAAKPSICSVSHREEGHCVRGQHFSLSGLFNLFTQAALSYHRTSVVFYFSLYFCQSSATTIFNSMRQSHCSKTSRSPYTHHIPSILMKSKYHCCFHKISPMVPVPYQMS